VVVRRDGRGGARARTPKSRDSIADRVPWPDLFFPSCPILPVLDPRAVAVAVAVAPPMEMRGDKGGEESWSRLGLAAERELGARASARARGSFMESGLGGRGSARGWMDDGTREGRAFRDTDLAVTPCLPRARHFGHLGAWHGGNPAFPAMDRSGRRDASGALGVAAAGGGQGRDTTSQPVVSAVRAGRLASSGPTFSSKSKGDKKEDPGSDVSREYPRLEPGKSADAISILQ